MIKVLLIEDNRLLRDGTAAMLNEQEDITVVSAAGTKSALERAKEFVPDIVLLDVGLKSRSSMKVLESVKKAHPSVEVVVMDLIPAHSEVAAFVKAGVSGFISKDSTLDEFLRTIRAAAKGVGALPPTIADSVFSQVVEHAIQDGAASHVIASIKFTKQEQKVIALVADAKSITEIAHVLHIAAHTVKGHVRNILDKLALHTRLELAAVPQ